jgi:hypothetical protein
MWKFCFSTIIPIMLKRLSQIVANLLKNIARKYSMFPCIFAMFDWATDLILNYIANTKGLREEYLDWNKTCLVNSFRDKNTIRRNLWVRGFDARSQDSQNSIYSCETVRQHATKSCEFPPGTPFTGNVDTVGRDWPLISPSTVALLLDRTWIIGLAPRCALRKSSNRSDLSFVLSNSA